MDDKVFKKMYHKIFYDGSLQASEKAEKEEDLRAKWTRNFTKWRAIYTSNSVKKSGCLSLEIALYAVIR